MRRPKLRETFKLFEQSISDSRPFTFVRFSDGEMEIIKNNTLVIDSTKVEWSGRVHYGHSYPKFDRKTFQPASPLGKYFRKDLLASGLYRSDNYYKGIPSSDNYAAADRKLMVGLNGGTYANLTSSDLLINGNFLDFRTGTLPELASKSNVSVLGNGRMSPEKINAKWKLLPIPDNFFLVYDHLRTELLDTLLNLPEEELILGSASSLSNVMGHLLHRERPDLTFIDIGTSLHDLMGMKSGIRGYHAQLLPRHSRERLKYRMSRNYHVRW